MWAKSDTLRKAVFIDRDGVINEERNYVHRVEDFVLLPRVAEGLAILRSAGYLLVVVTNQAGIARGYYDEPALERLHSYLRDALAERGVMLDAIYHCPHHPDGKILKYAVVCDCRKPAPGMLLRAIRDFNLDPAQCALIGDKLSDLQAGRSANVGRVVAVESGHVLDAQTQANADDVAKDLFVASQLITR